MIAAISHTTADYETVREVIDAGASVATHLYSGMPPTRGREPGPAPALFGDERVVVELIADRFRLYPATIRFAAHVATCRFALSTDAMAATGCGEGEYLLGGRRVEVSAGEVRLAEGDSLADNTLILDLALRVAVAAGVGFHAALATVTSTPARALGLGESSGTIAAGRVADLVALDDYTMRAVVDRGRRSSLAESPVVRVTETSGWRPEPW